MNDDLASHESSLTQAREIMSHCRASEDAEEWLLLATIVGEAALAFRAACRRNPSASFPLLEAALR